MASLLHSNNKCMYPKEIPYDLFQVNFTLDDA